MVYIKEFDKRIFPYFIKPEEKELFSSWFCRMAINHGVKPQTFSLNYLGRELPIWTRDVDLFPRSNLIQFIAAHTPLDNSRIFDMFLSSYKTIIFNKANAFTQNILALGIHHRKRKRKGLMFCWKCLGSKNIYYRKDWRLISSIVCVDCEEFLQDSCPNCLSVVAFHRINMSNNISVMKFKPLNLCSNCGFDLSNSILKIKPSNQDLNYQIEINKIIDQGFKNYKISSESYIRTLLYLTRKIGSSSKHNPFRKVFLNTYKIAFEAIGGELRYWDIHSRRFILPYVFEMLNDMFNLKNMLDVNSVSRSRLDPDHILPEWFIEFIYDKNH